MKRGWKRLLRLAKILDKADKQHNKRDEPLYYQGSFQHPCGAPACALGHWAAHNPARWTFTKPNGVPRLRGHNVSIANDCKEFDIPTNEWGNLFSGHGCGFADTGKEAARFIRQYVKDKVKEARA